MIERHQWKNLERALELCRQTADYPPGARFKWNTEVLWAADSYLQKASPEKQQALIDAIRAGSIGLDALYGNELTGLCRPEELLRLCECSQRLAGRCGVKIDSAMISDVPGYTWGIVPALAQAGVKYFSIGPNNFARVGKTLDHLGRQAVLLARPRRSGEGVVLGSVQRIFGGLRRTRSSSWSARRFPSCKGRTILTTSPICVGAAATTARSTPRCPMRSGTGTKSTLARNWRLPQPRKRSSRSRSSTATSCPPSAAIGPVLGRRSRFGRTGNRHQPHGRRATGAG